MSSDYARSWKPQQHSALNPLVLRAALVAAGVVGVAAAGYGGYAFLAHTPRVVPLIEADSRPLRVRPEDRGGMQVAGADESFMGGPGTGRADTMAPPPEAPQPRALRAQIQAARQPGTPPPVQSAAIAEAPPPAPAPTAPAPTASARPTPPPTAAGKTEVQLAAMPTEQLALAEWQRLSKRMPELLATRHPAVQQVDRGGKPLWRLRTGGFADTATATAFCAEVHAKGGGCSIASF